MIITISGRESFYHFVKYLITTFEGWLQKMCVYHVDEFLLPRINICNHPCISVGLLLLT